MRRKEIEMARVVEIIAEEDKTKLGAGAKCRLTLEQRIVASSLAELLVETTAAQRRLLKLIRKVIGEEAAESSATRKPDHRAVVRLANDKRDAIFGSRRLRPHKTPAVTPTA
jgi:hypothetical protein